VDTIRTGRNRFADPFRATAHMECLSHRDVPARLLADRGRRILRCDGTDEGVVVVEDSEGRSFDPHRFGAELAAAPRNLDVGTTLWFTNPHVKVWEVRLAPGERAPFHAHTHRYFWTCVEAGSAVQRTGDGTLAERRYQVGDTLYTHHDDDHVTIHDLENVGDTVLRFVTVELLDPLPANQDPDEEE
jgi:beta-alanine degradation protein BauB